MRHNTPRPHSLSLLGFLVQVLDASKNRREVRHVVLCNDVLLFLSVRMKNAGNAKQKSLVYQVHIPVVRVGGGGGAHRTL